MQTAADEFEYVLREGNVAVGTSIQQQRKLFQKELKEIGMRTGNQAGSCYCRLRMSDELSIADDCKLNHAQTLYILYMYT